MLYTRLGALVLVTVLVAGCGDSSKTATSASTATESKAATQVQTSAPTETTAAVPVSHGKALSRAVLTARAEAICGRIRARLNRNKFTTEPDIARLAPRVAAYEQTAVSEMNKLVPPSSLSDDWKQIVKGVQALASDARMIGVYAKAGQLHTAAGLAFAHETGLHGIHESEIASRDGFKVCAVAI